MKNDLEHIESMKRLLIRQNKLIKLLHDEIKAGGEGFYHKESMDLIDKAVLELSKKVDELTKEG